MLESKRWHQYGLYENDVGNVLSDADGMNDICRKYMEKRLNAENEWDGEVGCPDVMVACCLFLKMRLQQL